VFFVCHWLGLGAFLSFEVTDFRAVLVCLGSVCESGVLHGRVLSAARIPLDLKLPISARYLYDLGQLVRMECCMRDLGFAF
jgi:hypothetical protein